MQQDASRVLKTPEFTLQIAKDKKTQIVVSKKVAPKSVDRNRIRRTFKEALKEIALKDNLKIIVKENLKGLKTQQIISLLKNSLKIWPKR